MRLIIRKRLYLSIGLRGGYTVEAIEYSNKLNPRKYKLEFIDSNEMLNKSKEIQSKKFKQILKEYYLTDL